MSAIEQAIRDAVEKGGYQVKHDMAAEQEAIEFGAQAEREAILKLLNPCEEYCKEMNGRPDCKNCGLNLEELITPRNKDI